MATVASRPKGAAVLAAVWTVKAAFAPMPRMADVDPYKPEAVDPKGFNPKCKLPYGVTCEHVAKAMSDFVEFLGFINALLKTKEMSRFETMLMPANFSSIVGEFMSAGIPKYCESIVKNQYHNGHPDLIPANEFPKDMVQHGSRGIEVKASRYSKAWQGHNAEDCWLMVFVFSGGRPTDERKGIEMMPFRFDMVVGAELCKADWKFAGRSETSRRTITASIIDSGYQKMTTNWLYRRPTPNWF